ncbi:DUF4142 domain-containing protein [Rufibacter soli]|jgi:putative membrane protein
MKKSNIWLVASSFVLGSLGMVSCNTVDKEAYAKDQVKVEKFLQEAATTDNFQLMAGMMAGDQAKSGDVGALGQKIYHVHSRTTPVLADIAKQKDVKLPAEMGTEKKAIVDSLETKKGAEFDKSFAEAEVKAYEEAVAVYEKADKEVADKDVQAFIDQILPVLKEHLSEAVALQTELAKPGQSRP